MKTTNISKKLFAVASCFFLTATVLHAQHSVQNKLPTPPPANGFGVPPPPPPPSQPTLQQVETYQGAVLKLATNDEYVYDGFYMLHDGDSLLVKFPPHLGTQITGMVKTGASVSVSGVMNTSPWGKKEVRIMTAAVGGKTVSDTAAPMATPPAETYVSGSGKITALQTNREGLVSGLVVDGKTILHIPPHVATQLSAVVQTNAAVAYTGMKKAAGNGEVSATGYTIVHCRTITLNGKQYLIQ